MAAYIYTRPTNQDLPPTKHLWMLPFSKTDFDSIHSRRVHTIIATDHEAFHLRGFIDTPPVESNRDEYIWYGDVAQQLFENVQELYTKGGVE